MAAEHEPIDDLVARAATVGTVAELGELLRELRRREARARRGAVRSYRDLAERTGYSVASVGAYLGGMRVPPAERFDELLRQLGAHAHEYGPLANARDRVEDVERPHRVMARPATASPDVPAAPPGTLPAALSAFTGRAGALAMLDSALAPAAAPGAVVVTAVAGMGGVGKTALAVHWGHSAVEHFPGGQLYVNLRGYDSGEPLSTVDALGVLLSGLGSRPPTMPADEAGRRSLYQTILSGQRALVLLDNARCSAQVRPLLPPSSCLTLVTSRDDLADLAAEGDVRRVRLDVFAEDEAVALLRQLIGARADREPEAVRRLAKMCGYLPLALRVMAEIFVSRPGVVLADLVGEMETDLRSGGLDAFGATGDPRSDLHAVISWSVRCLPERTALALRLLGLVPGSDFDEYGLAALAGVTTAAAADLLATLCRAHLVDSWPPGRYSMHDLVRAYARESAERDLDPDARRAAMTRLLDYYLAAATAAAGVRSPVDRPSGPDRAVPAGETHIPDVRELDAAAAWLDVERPNLVAACVDAARNGWLAHAVATAVELWPFLAEGHSRDAVTVHTAVLTAAGKPGAAIDPRDRASVLAALAVAHYRLGDVDNASARAEESIAASHRAGEGRSAILGLSVLGAVHSAQGRFPDALAAFERALDIGRAHGPVAQIVPLGNLGEFYLTIQRFEAGADCFRQMADLATATGHLKSVAVAHRGIAMALVGLGRAAEAVPLAERAVALTRKYGMPVRLVAMLDTLARACRDAGLLPEAIDHLAEAVQLCRDTTGAYLASTVINTLGETYRQAGDHALALSSHEEAIELAERAPDRAERTRALVGMGDAHAALGDLDRARELWREALVHYTDMGLPVADAVEQRLRDAAT